MSKAGWVAEGDRYLSQDTGVTTVGQASCHQHWVSGVLTPRRGEVLTSGIYFKGFPEGLLCFDKGMVSETLVATEVAASVS